MGAVEIVIGYVEQVRGRFFNAVDRITHVFQKPPHGQTLSQIGVEWERDILISLMRRLERFTTVEFLDTYGSPVSIEMVEEKQGPDGECDLVIRIVAENERAAKAVATRIKNIKRLCL